MLNTISRSSPYTSLRLRFAFADDHALDDRRRLAGYSLARPRGTGTLFLLRNLGVWRRPDPAPSATAPSSVEKLVCQR